MGCKVSGALDRKKRTAFVCTGRQGQRPPEKNARNTKGHSGKNLKPVGSKFSVSTRRHLYRQDGPGGTGDIVYTLTVR